MSTQASQALIDTLKQRFERNMPRHPGIAWADVLARLHAASGRLSPLAAMENTGGEPDVIGGPDADGAYLFCDCAAESPAGRRSLCFDVDALNGRKENKPDGSVVELAQALGISLLTEDQYRTLQRFGAFDLKTSSWVATPPEIRKLGGALFCDRRYGQVFVYHNGAASYYAARGFRGAVSV